jgi:uncharacterized protein YecE (DUF72 family)
MTKTNFHVGTSGYGYKEWKGSFYPSDLPATKMLDYYGQRFRTVEMNNTFYRMPTASFLAALTKQVPSDFQFVLKAPQRITHFQRLRGAEESVGQFLDAAKALKRKLGPLLFQLPGNFKKDLPRLRDFLAILQSGQRVAFEFRHASWLDEETFTLLRKKKVALCVAESEDGIETPLLSTAPWGYLRLRMADYSDRDLKSWIERIGQQNWRNVYVFFKHEDEGKGPRFAARLLELCGQAP